MFRFDHHCYWMGTCIGARNLRWFMLFVGVQALTYVYGVFFLRTLLPHQPHFPSAFQFGFISYRLCLVFSAGAVERLQTSCGG